MVDKNPSKKLYRILETPNAHTVKSKGTPNSIRALEYDENNKMLGPPELIEVDFPQPQNREYYSVGEQLVIEVAEKLVPRITECLTDTAIAGFEKWLTKRKQIAKTRCTDGAILTRKTKAQLILERDNVPKQKTDLSTSSTAQEPFWELDIAYQEFSIDMTSEEFQKELIDIFVLSIIRARKIWRVSNANIVDTQGASIKPIDAVNLIEKLSEPQLLKTINALLKTKPTLLDDWQSIAFTDFTGVNLFDEGTYIPIERKLLTDGIFAK